MAKACRKVSLALLQERVCSEIQVNSNLNFPVLVTAYLSGDEERSGSATVSPHGTGTFSFGFIGFVCLKHIGVEGAGAVLVVEGSIRAIRTRAAQ